MASTKDIQFIGDPRGECPHVVLDPTGTPTIGYGFKLV